MPQISDADRKLLADILGRIQDDAPPDQPPTDPPVIAVPSKVPARVLDLVPWKLTLDLPGAPEIKPKALQDYTDDGFLVTLDGWVRMRAYCGGGHTTGSKYPRKEFRECNRDGTNASWSTTSGAHHLTVVHRITHLPVVKPEIVVAQIHDAADDVVMVRYEKGRLFVEAAGNEIALLDPDLPLGQTFTTGIDSSKGYIDVFVQRCPEDA
jgi:hypothetical protein